MRGGAHPTVNVIIQNLTVVESACACIAIGSEMSGGVENVTVVDSDFKVCDNGIHVKS